MANPNPIFPPYPTPFPLKMIALGFLGIHHLVFEYIIFLSMMMYSWTRLNFTEASVTRLMDQGNLASGNEIELNNSNRLV